MIKLIYKPLAIISGVLGGIIAGKIFEKLWGLFDKTPGNAPKPMDDAVPWSAVLPAAIASGAVHAGVKAVIQRGGAKAFQRSTGVWPGNPSPAVQAKD